MLTKAPPFEWNEANVGSLKQLWSEGLSCSQIADALQGKVSRNAVIGKVHRLKLPARGYATPAIQRAKARAHGNKGQPKANAIEAKIESRKSAPEPLPPQPYDVEDNLDATDVTYLVGRQDNVLGKNCQYPHGDPLTPEFRFCGKPTRNRRPYCDEHAQRCGTGYGRAPRP
jgi:GcrA cell cycle regulator